VKSLKLSDKRESYMKIFIIFGTRPEAIKLAPVICSLRKSFPIRVVSSGQHLDLTEQVIDFFELHPDYKFGCMTKKPDLENLYMCLARNIKGLIEREDPDLIIIQGDTLTAFAACFMGFMLKKPVFHVEAGLRTFRKFLPYPEEMLRVLMSRIADVHFAPTRQAAENLILEGIRKDRIIITGNTVVDALLLAQTLIDEKRVINDLSQNGANAETLMSGKKLVLVTSHRRENIGVPLKNICKAVKRLAREYKNTIFLWALHKNIEVRNIVLEMMKSRPKNLLIAEAFSYETMVYLMKKSHILLTDSGGIQEEAPAFGKPVIILRDTTERPEVIDSGFGFLAGSNVEKIMNIFSKIHRNKDMYAHLAKKKNPFGDGKASERIRQFLMLDTVQSFIKNYPSSVESSIPLKGKIYIQEGRQ
jgi:UDP-N-acetylglucosamine 2-epimerase (non-hydrolysing)